MRETKCKSIHTGFSEPISLGDNCDLYSLPWDLPHYPNCAKCRSSSLGVLVCHVLLQDNILDWVIYKTKNNILHNIKASAPGNFSLDCLMVEGKKQSQKSGREQERSQLALVTNFLSVPVITNPI